jgi:hypothetical protein
VDLEGGEWIEMGGPRNGAMKRREMRGLIMTKQKRAA